MKNASILTIGDELLIGQVIDTNSAWMGKQLNQLGIEVVQRIAVGDNEVDITYGLEQCIEKSDIVLITGGLGPTNDDITIEVLARYLGQELAFHQETYDAMCSIFAGRQIPVTEGHRRQCMLPSQAEILSNRLGTAPGVLIEHKDTWMFSMPGVPYEMKAIMNDHMLPRLRALQGDNHIMHTTILTAGVPESTLAHELTDIEDQLPDGVKMAYLPSINRVRIRLSGRGSNLKQVEAQVEEVKGKIEQRLGDSIYGYDEDTMVSIIANICKEKRLMIGTAESCTGGRVASRIVEEAGVSSIFAGGVVAYSYELKTKLLGVSTDTLQTYGAVSQETVESMVDGAISNMHVDVAVAISGIAGPAGGLPDKPVGTIWICVGNTDKKESLMLRGSKNRKKNIEYASAYALNLLRKFLIAQYIG